MKYYLHDSNSFNDEKVTELYIKFGYEGLGLFYTLLEKLASQEKPVKTSILKHQLKVGKKLNKCWNFMESLELISSNNGDTFNEQLLKFSEKYQIKKENNRKKISEWREKQAVVKNVTGYEPISNLPKVKESKDKVKKEYIYNAFYDSEIKKTDNPKYEQFVKYLFGNNKLKIKLSGVLSITNQLKAADFEKVLESCEINKKKIGDIVTKIENDKKYFKGKTNLYRTLLNWLEDRFTK